MAIESATFLTQLVPSNPPAGDPVANAADHLRLIKSVLQASLPNINATVTATPKNLNSDTVPVGGIIIWSGATNAVPTSWGLCDGSTYAKTDGSGNLTAPDLRDRFIVGAGSTYAVGATGGAVSNTPTITVDGHSLTQAELPNYALAATSTATSTATTTVNVTDNNVHAGTFTTGLNPGSGTATAGGDQTLKSNMFSANTSVSTTVNTTVSSGGSGTAHPHDASSSVVPTLPPYYALAFIIKL